MLILKNIVLKIKSDFLAEHILNVFVALVVLIIVVLSSIALCGPISDKQYQHIVVLSEQQSLPATQYIAIKLLHEPMVSSADYLRLMHANHFESSKIKKYPAMAIEDE